MNTLTSIFLIFGLGSTEIMFILLVILVPYFIPAIIARNKVHFTWILLLNVFLGWTIAGWVGALVWAITDQTPEELNRAVNANKPMANANQKYKCNFCGFEHYEKTTFCPVCSKDEHGLTLEDYKSKASAPNQP